MVEIQACATGLVNPSALCAAIDQESKGENMNVIARMADELHRERQRNAKLMERISFLEAKLLQGRVKDPELGDELGSCSKRRSFKRLKRSREEAIMKDGTQFLSPKEVNLEDRLVSWMSMDETQFVHYEKLKECDNTVDCVDSDETDNENDYYHEESEIPFDIKDWETNGNSRSVNGVKQDIYHDSNSERMENQSGPENKPTFVDDQTETKETGKKLEPKSERNETKNSELYDRNRNILGSGNDVGFGSVSLQRKPPKLAFCPKEVKGIIESEALLQRNAQSHTMRKIIVFSCLGIRHGCEEMMARLANPRSGSFFFKALGITLLFMAGFPDDLVRKETKYRNLDLLQKYYRTDKDAAGEELFLARSTADSNDDKFVQEQLAGNTISTKSRGKKQTSTSEQPGSSDKTAPHLAPSSTRFGSVGYTSIQTRAMAAFQSLPSPSQTPIDSNHPISSCAVASYQNQNPLNYFPPNAFVPLMYWPPPNSFNPGLYPSAYTYHSFPYSGNFISFNQPHCSFPYSPFTPKAMEDAKNEDLSEETDTPLLLQARPQLPPRQLNHVLLKPHNLPSQSYPARSLSVSPVHCGLRELRDRIDSVKNTQKITEAMKLVAAVKVRRAQEAVVNGRPFSEALVEVLYNINEQLQTEDIDTPLTKVRPVKKVALVVVTGDRGLCGGFNNSIIKKAEARISEFKELSLDYTVISVGKKGNTYFLRRLYIPDPVQILDALLPLYLNSHILRSLQESLASELAARMSAMSNATDNASELKRTLSIVYNRQRQAKITGEILEIVAGANALT
ncbi:ATP synthase gamma chain, chloroplastic, partial [Cucurbita argyrosperma subsp. argyrosperma]